MRFLGKYSHPCPIPCHSLAGVPRRKQGVGPANLKSDGASQFPCVPQNGGRTDRADGLMNVQAAFLAEPENSES